MITASAGRTLRDNGWAIRGIPLRDVETKGPPPPSEVSTILISLGSGHLSAQEVKAFQSYRAAGGCLIVLGGSDPRDMTGLKKYFVHCGG